MKSIAQSLIILMSFAAASALPQQAAPRKETRAIPISRGNTLVVHNDYGKVDLRPGTGPRVLARIGKNVADQSRLSEVEVVAHNSGGKIFLQSYFFDYRGESVDFEITLPSWANVIVWGANPSVSIEGMEGFVRIQTLTGSIQARNLSGAASLLTESGSIDYRLGRQPLHEARMETISGSIDLRVVEGLHARLWMRAGDRLTWEGTWDPDIRQSERQLGEGGPLLYAGSLGGNVGFATADAQYVQTRSPIPSPPSRPQRSDRSRPQSAPELAGDSNRSDRPDSRRQRPPQLKTPDEERQPDIRVASQPPPADAIPQDGDASSQPVFRAAVNWISLNVSVRDRRTNRSIPNLGADDFLVYEDGDEQQVARFESNEAPISLLLLLDVSGSTRSAMRLIQRSSINFTREIKANDRIALAAFNSRVRLVQPFTNDRMEMADAISSLRSGGGTAFYDALDASIRDYMRDVEGRKAIVVFTDGVDNQLTGDWSNGSRTTFAELFREIQEIDTTIYTIFLDTEGQVTTRSGGRRRGGLGGILGGIILGRGGNNRRLGGNAYDEARRQLEKIAEQTGGRMYSPFDVRDLDHVYSEIADDLRVQYTLAYTSTNPERDGSWREIEVRIRDNRDWVARTRRGYYASDSNSSSPSSQRRRFLP